ncbi:MAG: 16S rRNA (guanine(527)-N(7))-methyltransferase RsmG [Clostridiales bacterium]|nr:16S rRNA (guanine(527)-N(7))-methyltransferase RsmG [Clostridiales bacterium]
MDKILNEGFASLGITPDAKAVERLKTYFEYLEERNRVMNLTAISGTDDVARLHFLDCAALLKVCDFEDKKVIDIGTGAGFPGMVLKTVQPGMDITLLDSLNKRIDFLSEVCNKLALDGVQCVHARAEEIPEERRAAYDIAVSRAVARLGTLCELCLPYLRVGGVFIAMKGPDCDTEVEEAKSAMHLLGAQLKDIVRYTIPGTDITHAAVVIEKIKPTHPKYPRKWSQIKKQPL